MCVNSLYDKCFSGGNTDLRGFEQRFSRDLRELLPEHSPIINVRSYPGGTKSINAVMGAHAVPVPIPYGNRVQNEFFLLSLYYLQKIF